MPVRQSFELVSPFKAAGDQVEAIDALVKGIQQGDKAQTLLGVTGSGKTFTMANVIAKLNRPTMILSHNKTLAAQLYGEMREFFPKNAVEYFVSYYDYYQPGKCVNFSLKTPLSILFLITIIISLRHISRQPILLLRKTPK